MKNATGTSEFRLAQGDTVILTENDSNDGKQDYCVNPYGMPVNDSQ